MSNKFSTYFREKIENILKENKHQSPITSHLEEQSKVPSLTNLTPVSQEDVKKNIMEGNNKSCVLDPIPTTLFKSSLDCLLPVITEVINRSIASSTFPSKFKTASVTPLLKKPDLEADELRNYRPVSNLPYLGKITEKMVVKQLKNHMSKHNLNQPAQSAYRVNHRRYYLGGGRSGEW